MASWKIEPCTVDGARHLAHINICAWWTDSHWRLQWPEHITREFLIDQCAKILPNNMNWYREDERYQKAVDPETGAIVGYACWELPASHYNERLALPGRPRSSGGTATVWPDAQIPQVSAARFDWFRKRAKSAWWEPIDMEDDDDIATMKLSRIRSEKPYLFLEELLVHPENKGKGIGTALVESGIRQAEKMGLDICLWSTQAGVNLYKRLGFKEVDRVIENDSPWGGTGEYVLYLLILEVNKSSVRNNSLHNGTGRTASQHVYWSYNTEDQVVAPSLRNLYKQRSRKPFTLSDVVLVLESLDVIVSALILLPIALLSAWSDRHSRGPGAGVVSDPVWRPRQQG